MRYLLQVILSKSNCDSNLMYDHLLTFEVDFTYDEDDYGNGFYVSIDSGDGFSRFIDLRYNKDFRKNQKEVWLAKWAYNYWNGENDSYKVKRLTIEEVSF